MSDQPTKARCGSTHHTGCACWEAERTALVIRLRAERDAALNREALALQRVADLEALLACASRFEDNADGHLGGWWIERDGVDWALYVMNDDGTAADTHGPFPTRDAAFAARGTL